MVSVQPFNLSSICLVMEPGVLDMLIDLYTFCKGLQENPQHVCDYHERKKASYGLKVGGVGNLCSNFAKVLFFKFMCVVLGLNEKETNFCQFTQ